MNNCLHAHVRPKIFRGLGGIDKPKIPKWFIAMKLSLILSLCCGLFAQASVMAQKISVKAEKASFRSIMQQIQQKSDYSFLVKENYLKQSRPITLNVTEADVEDILPRIFEGQPFGYEIKGKVISVVDKTDKPPIDQPAQQDKIVQGTVTDSLGKPLGNVNIRVKGTSRGFVTDEEGRFSVRNLNRDVVLVFSLIGYRPTEVALSGNVSLPNGISLREDPGQIQLSVAMRYVVSQMKAAEITVNTGYQSLSPERMTGSYVTIDNELLNRRVSTNILDRIDGVTSGLVFNKTAGNYSGREPTISIRGRSTINANAEPLIILDNFPYDGNMADINPNDVESITILKDAAAASVWGARSGNGVIVITTKRGQFGQQPKVSATINTTIGEKPDLYYAPQLSSSEYIEVEKFLFDQGMFDRRISSPFQSISPAVEIFDKMDGGLLSEAEGNAQLDVLRGYDIREQQEKYLYQPSINQQYNLNVQGGGQHQQYYLSAGYDRNRESAVRNNMERFTINTRNTYSLFKNKLALSGQILFTQTNSYSGASYIPTYPYEQIADAQGNPLPIISPYNGLKPSFTDNAKQLGLLDWRYIPLEELYQQYTTGDRTDYRINLSADYKIIPELTASVQYQYGRGMSGDTRTSESGSYFTRDQINTFSNVDESTGVVTRPIPLGDIISNRQSQYTSQYGRAQLQFDKNWNGKHHLSSFAAFEVKDLQSNNQQVELYGYDPATAINTTVDLLTSFPIYTTGSGRQIPSSNSQGFLTDRFRSYIGNISYTYLQRYTLFGSIRRDESNLFGVKTNQKGVPLWSAGGNWQVDKESFYHVEWLDNLKLRMSYGRQGNIDRSVTAYLTARSFSRNIYGDPYANLTNPPNPSLRWEKSNVFNSGLDFTMLGNLLNGSLDFYVKNASDLIGNSPIAPQTGLNSFRGNVANMETKGIDVNITGNWVKQEFNWTTNFIYSYVKDKITKYEVEQTTNYSYMQRNYVNPYEGYPYSALFSFPFLGLDGEGNPLGLVDGQPSADYGALINMTGIENMVYHGSQVPTHFGSIRNTFGYKNFIFSFNITFKAGYYYRRSSLNNGNLYQDVPIAGIADYASRWQVSGDESWTNVPSLIYPSNSSRDAFYQYSDILVENASHIRLQDIQLSYLFGNSRIMPFKDLQFNCYLNNVAILYRSNNHNWDPDVHQGGGYPVPRTISLGFTAKF